MEAAELRTCAEVEAALELKPGTLGEGCYVATAGWMLRRLEAEQALEAELAKCEQQ